MATVTLEYDSRNSNLKKALDLFVSLGAKVISAPQKHQETKTKMSSIDISLKEIEEGKVHTYSSSKEMFEKLGITL